MGTLTLETVRAFQKVHNLPLGWEVDEATAAAINAAVDALPSANEQFAVEGVLFDSQDSPLPGFQVYLYDVDLRGAAVYEQAATLDDLEQAEGLEPFGQAKTDTQGRYRVILTN